jgi:CubicO group peptidase (beta-lactamase class C family)
MKKSALVFLTFFLCVAGAQNVVAQVASAPDNLLLKKTGPAWWYTTKPSPQPIEIKQRVPSPAELEVITTARALLANRPAKAIALVDGDDVVLSEFKAPANAQAMFYGYSMGKTVTSMAVGKAICQGKLKLDTKSEELVPELKGKALGNASVADLLKMASGTADPNPDSTIFVGDQAKEWFAGKLSYIDVLSSDRVATAKQGVFGDYKPGEQFSYKSTDPLLLSIMLSRATGMGGGEWVQREVLNPMGAASPGLYEQDKDHQGQGSAGLNATLDDWIRFGRWVKRSSKESGCFGDFVRAALSTKIRNSGTVQTRKFGGLFAGYGYYVWTENQIAADTAWFVGYGGQRIGIDLKSERMIVVFSNLESWMPEIYELSKSWNKLSR